MILLPMGSRALQRAASVYDSLGAWLEQHGPDPAGDPMEECDWLIYDLESYLASRGELAIDLAADLVVLCDRILACVSPQTPELRRLLTNLREVAASEAARLPQEELSALVREAVADPVAGSRLRVMGGRIYVQARVAGALLTFHVARRDDLADFLALLDAATLGRVVIERFLGVPIRARWDGKSWTLRGLKSPA